MAGHPTPQGTGGGAPQWESALAELERALRDASWAITLLRRSLEEGGGNATAEPPTAKPHLVRPAPRTAPPTDDDPPEPAGVPAPVDETASEDGQYAPSTFERLWDRIERERMEKEGPAEPAPERRGLAALPQQYLMTVEDRESKVDLVPLHRALLNLADFDDVSLVSYANGVPVISLRVDGELDLDRLQGIVATAMDRECEVIPQDNGKLFIRLRPNGVAE